MSAKRDFGILLVARGALAVNAIPLDHIILRAIPIPASASANPELLDYSAINARPINTASLRKAVNRASAMPAAPKALNVTNQASVRVTKMSKVGLVIAVKRTNMIDTRGAWTARPAII